MNDLHIEFGSDIDTKANEKYIDNNANTNWLNNSYLFRCARDILKFIAKTKKNSTSNRILMPIFCCDSMVKPFKMYGYEVIYYPLLTDYSIDTNFINNTIKPNDIILIENYLSLKKSSLSSFENSFFKELKSRLSSIIIIKDYTHSLNEVLYNDKSSEDFSIFSVRKWASFPDGGILWSKYKIDINYDVYDSNYFDLKKKAMDLKSEYLETHNPNTKIEFLKLFKEADSVIEDSYSIMEISDYSKKLLYNLNFEKILKTRLENIKYLDENVVTIKKLLNKETCSGLYFPIYITGNQKDFQKYLAQNNIYCPIIWPLENGYENFSSFSTDIISHMLSVPCDQRYSKKDLDYIIKYLNKGAEQFIK